MTIPESHQTSESAKLKRGEIWLVSLDPSSGREQKGRRPVLVVSPEAFNRITKVPVVLPITSGGRKLESIPDAIMSEVLARISPIFE